LESERTPILEGLKVVHAEMLARMQLLIRPMPEEEHITLK
jgi:hypothetical protein